MVKLGAVTSMVVAITLVVCLLGCLSPRQNHSINASGDSIAFSAGFSFWLSGLALNYDIYVMDINNSRVTRLTREPGSRQCQPGHRKVTNCILWF
jgi:Tol biopolymer transport system component